MNISKFYTRILNDKNTTQEEIQALDIPAGFVAFNSMTNTLKTYGKLKRFCDITTREELIRRLDTQDGYEIRANHWDPRITKVWNVLSVGIFKRSLERAGLISYTRTRPDQLEALMVYCLRVGKTEKVVYI